MSINKKIQEAQQGIADSLSGLPIGVCYLLLKDILKEVERQYIECINSEIKEEKENTEQQ